MYCREMSKLDEIIYKNAIYSDGRMIGLKITNKLLNYLIYAYIILLPLIYSGFKYNGIVLNGDRILTLILFTYLFNIIVIKDSRKKFIMGFKDFFKDYLGISIILLIVIMFISIHFSTDFKIRIQDGVEKTYAASKVKALYTSIRFCMYVAIYFIIKYEIDDKKVIDNMLKCYISVCTLVSAIGIVGFLTPLNLIEEGESEGLRRSISTLENSNNLGMFLIFVVFPLIVLSIYEKIKYKKILYICASVLVFTNIILTSSRNAWIGFAAGSALITLAFSYKFIIMFVALGGMALFIPPIFNRIKEIGDPAQNQSRLIIWQVACRMIKEHPIFGVGNGNFSLLYLGYAINDVYDHVERVHAHNAFLNVQSELGIFGLIFFTAMLIFMLLKVKKLAQTTTDFYYKCFFKGFFVSFIVFIGMNVLDDFFEASKVITYLFVITAIADCLLYRQQKKQIFINIT